MARVICPNCSNPYTPAPGGIERCPRCGYGPGGAASATAWAPSATATFAPAMTPPGPAFSPVDTQRAPNQGTNGFAVTSMVLGIVAVIPIPFVGGVLALLAIIFGSVALRQVKARGQPGFGMALTGIVLGSIVVLLYVAFFAFIMSFFAMMNWFV